MKKPLEEIAALVHRESGMVLREAQFEALGAALERTGSKCGPEAFLREVTDPVVGARHLAVLVDEVTVKETFFLRDARQLEQIRWPALLDQARSRGDRTVRVWSAGCATGEEAYSLALLACEAFCTFEPPVSILATDISASALTRAAQGDYRPRSTRELAPALRQRYFREEGERLVAGESLRALVTFKRHNLVHDPAPPPREAPFDLILCRNVLIYFDSDTVDRVIAALEGALVPAGALVLGAADALCRSAGRLRTLAEEAPWPGPPLRPSKRALRRPLGRPSPPPLGSWDDVVAQTSSALAADPLDATAHFLRGLAELETGNAAAAVAALRHALYSHPRFGLAAFQLGRSYEALGNLTAALRSYEQALRTLEPDEDLHEPLLGQIELDDIRAAARSRLEALAAVGIASRTSRLSGTIA